MNDISKKYIHILHAKSVGNFFFHGNIWVFLLENNLRNFFVYSLTVVVLSPWATWSINFLVHSEILTRLNKCCFQFSPYKLHSSIKPLSKFFKCSIPRLFCKFKKNYDPIPSLMDSVGSFLPSNITKFITMPLMCCEAISALSSC